MSCGGAGFHGPGGLLLLSWVGAVRALGQGIPRARLTASANSCAQGQVSGSRGQVAGTGDQAGRGVQQPVAQVAGPASASGPSNSSSHVQHSRSIATAAAVIQAVLMAKDATASGPGRCPCRTG